MPEPESKPSTKKVLCPECVENNKSTQVEVTADECPECGLEISKVLKFARVLKYAQKMNETPTEPKTEKKNKPGRLGVFD